MDYWRTIRQLVGKETLVIPAAAGAIVQDGKILLARHGLFKKWHIPGGGQEVGESIQDTIRREIKEELALDMEPRELIGVYSGSRWMVEHPDGNRTQPLMFFFKMEGEIGPIKLQEEEVTAFEFFDLHQIPEDTMDCCKQKALDLLNYQGQTFFR